METQDGETTSFQDVEPARTEGPFVSGTVCTNVRSSQVSPVRPICAPRARTWLQWGFEEQAGQQLRSGHHPSPGTSRALCLKDRRRARPLAGHCQHTATGRGFRGGGGRGAEGRMGSQGEGREPRGGLPPCQSSRGLLLDPRLGWWTPLPSQRGPLPPFEGLFSFPRGQFCSNKRPSGLGPLNSTWRTSVDRSSRRQDTVSVGGEGEKLAAPGAVPRRPCAGAPAPAPVLQPSHSCCW